MDSTRNTKLTVTNDTKNDIQSMRALQQAVNHHVYMNSRAQPVRDFENRTALFFKSLSSQENYKKACLAMSMVTKPRIANELWSTIAKDFLGIVELDFERRDLTRNWRTAVTTAATIIAHMDDGPPTLRQIITLANDLRHALNEDDAIRRSLLR